MPAKYIPITTSFPQGKAFLSAKSLSEIAKSALVDMPNVSFQAASTAPEKGGISIKVCRDILTWLKDGQPVITIHVLIRSGENASALSTLIQKDVSESILSFTEIPTCKVDVRIDGMF